VCLVCTDEPEQVVLDFTTGGGEGQIFQEGIYGYGLDGYIAAPSYDLVCEETGVTAALDICCFIQHGFQVCGSEATRLPPSGNPLSSPFGPIEPPSEWSDKTWTKGTVPGVNCAYAEQSELQFTADFTTNATGRYLNATESGAPTVFPQEGLYGNEFVTLRSLAGFGSFASSASLSVLKHRDRRPPEVQIKALYFDEAQNKTVEHPVVLTPTIQQKADDYGRPYWRLNSVAVSGTPVTSGQGPVLEAKVLNGSGDFPYLHPVFKGPGGALSEVQVYDGGFPFGFEKYKNYLSGLSGVQVTRARLEPTVSAIPPANTSGMDLSVTLAQQGTGLSATWSVQSVSVTTAGSGWEDGDAVTFSAAGGPDIVVEAEATAVLNVSRVAPTLTAKIGGGTGGTFTVSVTPNGSTPPTWGVASVSVSGLTNGYDDMEPVVFSAENTGIDSGAIAFARTGREEPDVGVGIVGSGTGADFSITLTETSDGAEWPSRPAWAISSVTITDGGTGYAVWDQLQATTTGQQSPSSYFFAIVDSVDENGAITSVQIYDGGLFFRSTGEIESVQVNDPGQYYGKQLNGVTITTAGKYYIQTYVDTTTPIEPVPCKNYSAWERFGPIVTGTKKGESWGNQVMVRDEGDIFVRTVWGYSPIRRCELGALEVSVQ
jgi:hypothetical protein